MFTKISRAWYLLIHPKLLKTLLSLPWYGYLKDLGWFNAFIRSESIDLDNNPIPWVTFPFIEFIKERLSKNLNLFEFGSGNSTLYFAEKVLSVTSVEHNKEWYLKINKQVPENVRLHYCELLVGGDYCNFINRFEMSFDIVIVDGRDRVNCIKNTVNALKNNGVIVLDDSERVEYADGVEYLLKNGFRKIDFSGIAAGIIERKSTSVFYRDYNCLGI